MIAKMWCRTLKTVAAADVGRALSVSRSVPGFLRESGRLGFAAVDIPERRRPFESVLD